MSGTVLHCNKMLINYEGWLLFFLDIKHLNRSECLYLWLHHAFEQVNDIIQAQSLNWFLFCTDISSWHGVWRHSIPMIALWQPLIFLMSGTQQPITCIICTCSCFSTILAFQKFLIPFAVPFIGMPFISVSFISVPFISVPQYLSFQYLSLQYLSLQYLSLQYLSARNSIAVEFFCYY